MAAPGEAETLQRLAVKLEGDRLGSGKKTLVAGELEITEVRHLVVALILGQRMVPEAAVLDVALELIGIRSAAAELLSIRATPAGERPDARRSLVTHDVVGIVAISWRAAVVDHARQLQPRAEVEQHRLKRPHVAVGFDHGMTDRVCRPVGIADRAI